MTSDKPIVPLEWYEFQDWLERRYRSAIEYENLEAAQHYRFVRNEWTSYVVDEYRVRSAKLEMEQMQKEKQHE